MPFPKKIVDDDDPEEIAEREVAKMNEELGVSDARWTKRTALHAAPQPSPVKPPTKQFKEAKALRKKRNRGVSGSSIKKDGGRFEYGLDYDNDYCDLTDDTDEDECSPYDNYTRDSHSVGIGSMESDSEHSNDSLNMKRKENEQVVRVRDCLVALCSDDDSSSKVSVADLLIEEYDETGRVRLIHDAISLICLEMNEVVGDPLYEHRLIVMVSFLIRQGLLRASSVSSYVENATESNHVIRLLTAANKIGNQTMNESEQIRDIEKLARDLVEEFDTECVASDLAKQEAVFFHAHFIHQVCLEAVGSMNMNVIYHATRAIADMVENNTLDRTSVNIGFLRFFKKIVDTIEMDLPGATSLATLLMSYAVNDFHLIDDSVSYNCPKPRRFIKANHQGMISVVEKDGEQCTALNYFSMET